MQPVVLTCSHGSMFAYQQLLTIHNTTDKLVLLLATASKCFANSKIIKSLFSFVIVSVINFQDKHNKHVHSLFFNVLQ